MIGYVTLGTNDLPRAVAFFDALLGELGAKHVMEFDKMIVWGIDFSQPMLALCNPHDGKPASIGNGTMVALNAGTREMADRLHAKALALGGTDEGAPGPRGDGFYGAYFRDPDGHKFVAFVMG